MALAQLRPLFLYAGFLIIATSLLMLQILYSRTLSIAFGFGFEFLVVSLVILGLGLGAIFVFFLLNNFPSPAHASFPLLAASLFYWASIPIPFLLLNSQSTFSLFLFFAAGFATYFLGGVIASLLFRYHSSRISKLYFLSLLGAALGVAGAVGLLELFLMPVRIILIIVLCSLPVILFALHAGLKKNLFLAMSALITAVIVFYFIGLDNRLHVACPVVSERPIATKSDSLSRLDVYRTGVSHYEVVRNCHSRAFVFNYGAMDDSQHDTDARIYFPFPTENISSGLMIGSAGGRGVIAAVEAGIPGITAVEINPLIVESTELLERRDNVYYHDSVEVFVEEGRSFVSGSKKKYDLIYLLGLTLGRLGYGAHLFSENYLYTKEAFDSYFAHLEEDGVLAIGVGAHSMPAITETAIITLLERGIDPAKRIVVFEDSIMGGKPRGLILIKNSDFSIAEGNSVITKAKSLELGAEFLTLNAEDIERTKNSRAMRDDHPYFFLVHEIYGQENWAVSFPPYLRNILLLLLAVLLAYMLTAALPFLKLKGLRSSNTPYLLGFFSAIGVGFITLELSFIHKFTLFLGHPVLSLSLTLASVLFFGGLGSLLTGRFEQRDIPRTLAKIIFALMVVVALLVLSTNILLAKLIFLDIALKVLFVITVLSLPSVLMGMVFPLGLRIAKRTGEKLIPWMVGIDGIASVLGGVLAFLLSLMYGFNAALVVGILFYSIAFFMVLKMK